MEKRMNAGYEIINVMKLKNQFGTEMEVVMGQKDETLGSPYVTWCYYPENNSYVHGHYLPSKEAVVKDFFERGMTEMGLDMRAEYRKEIEIAEIGEVLTWEFNKKQQEALLKNEAFMTKATERYDDLDRSRENEALREAVEDVYHSMVKQKDIFDFETLESISDKNITIEFQNEEVRIGIAKVNPNSSMASFFLECDAKEVETNVGKVPLEDYLEIKATQQGFDSYKELRAMGLAIDIPKEYISIEIQEIQSIKMDEKEIFPRNEIDNQLTELREHIKSTLLQVNELYPQVPSFLHKDLLQYVRCDMEMLDKAQQFIQENEVLYPEDKSDIMNVLYSEDNINHTLGLYYELDTMPREHFMEELKKAFCELHLLEAEVKPELDDQILAASEETKGTNPIKTNREMEK